MEPQEEKLNLLREMIAFALIDGELHDREYDFIEMVATELEIDKPTLHKLFENKDSVQILKDEFSRICQFYRLALLMHCDDVLHEREQIKINEIGINMGLNPFAMKRILNMLQKSPNGLIDGHLISFIFRTI